MGAAILDYQLICTQTHKKSTLHVTHGVGSDLGQQRDEIIRFINAGQLRCCRIT